ncbi:hypothetical protein Tco_1516626 [Tanacetum coccineum]
MSNRKYRALKEMIKFCFYSRLSERILGRGLVYWHYVVRLLETKRKSLRDAIFDENRFSSIPRPKDIVSSSNGTQGGDIPGYSDASWITNSEDHTYTIGWVFLLGGGAISWASKKQTCITDSTMESEFVALAAAVRLRQIWFKELIYEIPLWPKPISPISMHCDKAEFNEESLQLKIGAHYIIPRCKTKRTTYVSMECRRFKKLGLGFLYAHEGYGHKAL